MATIQMLGAYGGRDKDKATTSLLASEKVAIDAGNLLNPLGRDARRIDTIFLTHCHMDHLIDLPFLIDAFFSERTRPLDIYGLPKTLEMVRKHIFNNDIWPDFNEISLLNGLDRAIRLKPIHPGVDYEADGMKFTPFETNHTVPSVGYVIEKEGHKLMFTSDTYLCPNVWKVLNADEAISALIIEVSFPSKMGQLAEVSRHLTPALLDGELENLQRKGVAVYINHFKPDFIDAMRQELATGKNTRDVILLDDGQTIEF